MGCLIVVPEGALLIRADGSGAFRTGGPGIRFGSAGSSLQIAHPLPWRPSILLRGSGGSQLASLDLEAVRGRFAELVAAGRPLRWATSALGLYLFVGAPLWLAVADPRRTWIPLLAALAVLVLTVAACHIRAHRRLYLGVSSETWSAALAMILLPTDAVRAYAALSRDVMSGIDAMTALAALGDRRQVDDLLARRLRELEWPTEDERRARSGEERRAETERIASLLPPSAVTPAPADDGAVGRCPRCLAAYDRLVESCADCPGVPVLPVVRRPAGTAEA